MYLRAPSSDLAPPLFSHIRNTIIPRTSICWRIPAEAGSPSSNSGCLIRARRHSVCVLKEGGREGECKNGWLLHVLHHFHGPLRASRGAEKNFSSSCCKSVAEILTFYRSLNRPGLRSKIELAKSMCSNHKPGCISECKKALLTRVSPEYYVQDKRERISRV